MIMQNEFSRTELILGAAGLDRLRSASVAVFGVGGVGSHCVEALARSGVGRIALVDNDRVSVTNINRQSIAYHSTVGRYKTEVMRERIRDICPEIRVETFETFVLPENIEELFRQIGPVDYLVDAIDTVSAKLALAELAERERIRIISSMGTGNKLHPELFETADIMDTSVCPLCRVMRRELKKRGISRLKVVYSREKPVDIGGRETGEDPGERRSIPGSVSFVPPAAGLLIAAEVVRELAGAV